jgi:stage V sporulation protein G
MSDIQLKVDRIHKLSDNGPMRAFVDLSINDVLVIKGLRVIQGQKGLFVSMPQEQGKDKRWYDSIRCLSTEIRDRINEKVLTAYREAA